MRRLGIEKLRQIDRVLAGFVRGQLTICIILAVLYSLGFVIIRIDLAILLGTISGLLFIIPYVGTLTGLVMGSLMAVAKYGDLILVDPTAGQVVVSLPRSTAEMLGEKVTIKNYSFDERDSSATSFTRQD